MRLGFLSIFVSSLIILSAYSASLTSFLTVSTVSLPFSTMEEFVDHGSYGLITFRNSADYEIITVRRHVFGILYETNNIRTYGVSRYDFSLTIGA